MRKLLNVLIIICVIILFGILCGFVFGILDLGETTGIMLRTVGLILLIFLGLKLISQYNKKPQTKEMEEEGIKESEQKDEKQVLFKPSVGVLIFFMIFTFIPAFDIIYSLIKNKAEFDLTISTFSSIVLLIFFTWLWYTVPVFIFTDDAVQIKSFLFCFLRIDRKIIIRYSDITSVSPHTKNGSYGWGVTPIVIFLNGTTQGYILFGYDDDIIAKIYLRFKEKLGDKVTIP